MSAEKVQQLTRNPVVYSISDQDDAGFWIREHYPEITYIVDPSSQNAEDYARAAGPASAVINITVMRPARISPRFLSTGWMRISAAKGQWAKVTWKYLFIMEGDTPAFLGLIRNGLNSERNPG